MIETPYRLTCSGTEGANTLLAANMDCRHPYQKALGMGYEVKAVVDLVEIVKVCMGTRYHLIKDGEVIYEFVMKRPEVDAWMDQAIFDQVEAFLNDFIGERITSLMKDIFLKRFTADYPQEVILDE